MYSALGADMDSAFETQGQLEDQKEEVSARCCLASTVFVDSGSLITTPRRAACSPKGEPTQWWCFGPSRGGVLGAQHG